MKTLFFCLLITFSCAFSTNIHSFRDEPKNPPSLDTVYVEVPTLNEERIKELEADVAYWKRIADSVNTVIPYNEYMNARKIEKIKYYISITERNPKNKQFFYGWIKRTMSEE